MAGISISAIVQKSLRPLVWLCGVGMAIGGAGLVYAGFWYALSPALSVLLFAHILLPLLLTPANFCAGMARITGQSLPGFARFMSVCVFAYFALLMTGWVMLSLHAVRAMAPGDGSLPFVMIWSAASALFPWALFTDRENVFFVGLLWMAAAAALAIFGLLYAGIFAFSEAFWAMYLLIAAMMGVEWICETYILPPKTPPGTPGDTAATSS
jgi:hypothetical protein